jgi:undecaprenyl-diphosphatase
MSSPTDGSGARSLNGGPPQPARDSSSEPHRGELTLSHAVWLGALHGPAELLPISSSGHVALIPWLLGWGYHELDAELRKSFEVALHAGTAAALLLTLHDEVGEALRGLDLHRTALIGLSFAPPALAGFVLERPIERRLGTPPTVAAGLLTGAAAMALADRRPQARGRGEAGLRDALLLGIAQATALIPGVSRNGATLAAARALRFTREEANRLSRHAALPVIAGATGLKVVRLRRRGLPPGARRAFAAGTAASFASTLERDRSLLRYAVYRTALASVVLWRLSRMRRRPIAAVVVRPTASQRDPAHARQ